MSRRAPDNADGSNAFVPLSRHVHLAAMLLAKVREVHEYITCQCSDFV